MATVGRSCKLAFVIQMFLALLHWFCAFLRSRHQLGLELAVLHQQLAVLKRKNSRPHLSRLDRLFWVFVRQFWRRWSEVLVIVKPETVARWHRKGLRLYWRVLSRHGSRPKLAPTIRELVQRMAAENPTWGARESTVSC